MSARGEPAPGAGPLAILIPTFSRARHVERLLLALAADPDVIARRIPVLVADNDSSDDTAATVRRLMVQLPDLDLRLHVQPRNLGMIGNLRWLLDHAPPAEYVWWFGDDDFPEAGIVGDVLDAIAAYAPALVHVPCRFEENGAFVSASPCPETLETYFSSRELLLSDYWVSFISSTIARHAELARAIALAPTENDWAPHIWYGIAGSGDRCVVLPRVGIVGNPNHGWWEEHVALLTRGLVEEFDEGLNLVFDEAGFAAQLDVRYDPRWCNDTPWLSAPIEDLIWALSRFPGSRQLCRLLVTRARRDGDTSVVGTAVDAARRSGAAAAAALAVQAGEACFASSEPARAAECFEAAVAEDPTNVLAWCNLAVARHALDREDAGEAFDAALALDPGNVDALHNRAMWNASCGRLAAAATDLETLQASALEHPATRLTEEVLNLLTSR